MTEHDAESRACAARARELGAIISQKQAEIASLSLRRREHVRRLVALGLTYRRIGEMLGMSSARVSQIAGSGWVIASRKRVR